jgi:hypothetical protein
LGNGGAGFPESGATSAAIRSKDSHIGRHGSVPNCAEPPSMPPAGSDSCARGACGRRRRFDSGTAMAIQLSQLQRWPCSGVETWPLRHRRAAAGFACAVPRVRPRRPLASHSSRAASRPPEPPLFTASGIVLDASR